MVMRKPLPNEPEGNKGHIVCRTDGCGQSASWWVKAPTEVMHARCTHCRDELIAVFGHTFVEPMDKPLV